MPTTLHHRGCKPRVKRDYAWRQEMALRAKNKRHYVRLRRYKRTKRGNA